MTDRTLQPVCRVDATRRQFLGQVGQTVVAGAAGTVASSQWAVGQESVDEATAGRVRKRRLGKTDLEASEIGFGGHSWSFWQVPDGRGSFRRLSLDEAEQIIRVGLEMGVNFFDSCTPRVEHTVPGQIIKKLQLRDKVIVSARCCHKMKGTPADREKVYKFVDERLKLWQTDYFDILMLANEVYDTLRSGYWEMSYCIEALEKVKRQGKVRFTGFGCHFTPGLFLKAIHKYGEFFDICSIPYNIRHRAAERVMPVAKKAGLGIVTIKAFARGALLEKHNAREDNNGLARDMLAFVLDNKLVDTCVCGVTSEAELREDLSASWTGLTPKARQRLDGLAEKLCSAYPWLEQGWRYA